MRYILLPLFSLFSLLLLSCEDEGSDPTTCERYLKLDPLPSSAISVLDPPVKSGDVQVGPRPISGHQIVYTVRDSAWDWHNDYFYGGHLYLWDTTTGEQTLLNTLPPFQNGGCVIHEASLVGERLVARVTPPKDLEYEPRDYLYTLSTGVWEPLATEEVANADWTTTTARTLGTDRAYYLMEMAIPDEVNPDLPGRCDAHWLEPSTNARGVLGSWSSKCSSVDLKATDSYAALLVRQELYRHWGGEELEYVPLLGLGEYLPEHLSSQGETLLLECMTIRTETTGEGTQLHQEREIFALLEGQDTLRNLTEDTLYSQTGLVFTPPLMAYLDERGSCSREWTSIQGAVRIKSLETGLSLLLPPLGLKGEGKEPERVRPIGFLKSPWRLVLAYYGTPSFPADVAGNLALVDLEAAHLVTPEGALIQLP